MERLDREFEKLPGDCLIATGFVAYLGPFVSEYREALMDDWFREVILNSISLITLIALLSVIRVLWNFISCWISERKKKTKTVRR